MAWVTDSRQSGFLGPANTPAPLESDAWVDFLQALVAGVSGLDPTLVRPRWQPEPPNQPVLTVNWAAIGVTETESDWMPTIIHDGMITHVLDDSGNPVIDDDGNPIIEVGDGRDIFQRHERVTLLCSFYGPRCATYASLLRDGLFIDQNQAGLRSAAVGIIEVGDFVRAPELIKEGTYRDRMDVSVILRREVLRHYPVLNLLSATQSIQSA